MDRRRRLGGPQNPSGSGGEEKKSYHCPCWELNHGRPARIIIIIIIIIAIADNVSLFN
jgi:hypothetical protein